MDMRDNGDMSSMDPSMAAMAGHPRCRWSSLAATKEGYTKGRLNIRSQREPPQHGRTRELPQRILPYPTRCGVW